MFPYVVKERVPHKGILSKSIMDVQNRRMRMQPLFFLQRKTEFRIIIKGSYFDGDVAYDDI